MTKRLKNDAWKMTFLVGCLFLGAMLNFQGVGGVFLLFLTHVCLNYFHPLGNDSL